MQKENSGEIDNFSEKEEDNKSKDDINIIDNEKNEIKEDKENEEIEKGSKKEDEKEEIKSKENQLQILKITLIKILLSWK